MRRKQLGKHLNKREVLSARLVVKYHSDRPPDRTAKTSLIEAASLACKLMRTTVWEIDKVSLFRRDEKSVMTQVLDSHFGFKHHWDLNSGKNAKNELTNAKKRREWLDLIRRRMLSISFHLNTGMYLLDTDAGVRTIVGDNEIDNMNESWAEGDHVGATDANGDEVEDPNNPGYVLMRKDIKPNASGKRVLSKNIEGYAQTGSSGPVHVSFNLAKTYSALAFARLIIHEASHTFCGTTDVHYAHSKVLYDGESATNMIQNADSYAYAALSLGEKKLHDYASVNP